MGQAILSIGIAYHRRLHPCAADVYVSQILCIRSLNIYLEGGAL